MQDPHPFWRHLPPERRTRSALISLRWQRLRAWLQGRRQRLGLVCCFYVLIWSIPLLFGQPIITVFALLPLLLVPPVGALIYRLVWREFHG